MLPNDRTNTLIAAAKQLDEASFAKRYKTSFLVFPRPGEELTTTEVNLTTLSIPLEHATGLLRPTSSLDEPALLDQGFILEPLAGRWPGELGDVVTVGRARGNDIFIPDQTVSKVHAFFRLDEEGVYWVFDPGSRNGTFVGTTRLRVGTQHRLGESELITFGGVKALYKNAVGLQKFLKRATSPAGKSGASPRVAKS